MTVTNDNMDIANRRKFYEQPANARQRRLCHRRFGIPGSIECCKQVASCLEKMSDDVEDLQKAITDSDERLSKKSCGKINRSLVCVEDELADCDEIPRTVVRIRFAGPVKNFSSIVSKHCDGTDQYTDPPPVSTEYTTISDRQTSPITDTRTTATNPGVGHNTDTLTGGNNLTYAIVGACVGAVIAIAIVIAIIIMLRLKKRSKESREKSGVTDTVDDEETYTEINESFMAAVYNNGYPRLTPSQSTTRGFANPTPYRDIETISGHRDKYGDPSYELAVHNNIDGIESSAPYETLSADTKELPFRADYATISPTNTEIDTGNCISNGNAGLKNTCTNGVSLQEDAHGYLAPKNSHTYFVLEQQNSP